MRRATSNSSSSFMSNPKSVRANPVKRATVTSDASIEALEPRTLLSAALVSDINPGAEPSYPGFMVDVGGGVKVFTARDADHGQELWRTDGTPAGTYLVKDLLPGPDGGALNNDPKLVNGRVLFWSQDAESDGRQDLYQTDGTAEGTVRVGAGAISSLGSFTLSEDGTLAYFMDGPLGELWRTDGTAAGTFRLLSSDTAFGHATAVAGHTLFFSGPDEEPWATDGTVAGTLRLADVNPGDAPSFPRQFTVAGGVTYFWADDAVHGTELWRSDGTPAGTYLVQDVTPGAAASDPWITGQTGGALYFFNRTGTGAYDLWSSDGTAAGTTRFASGVDVTNGFGDNGTLYLALNDQLWKSDLTAAGTTRVSSAVSSPQSFAKVGGAVLFAGADAARGQELWRTDGTAAGTVRVADVNPGGPDSGPQFDRVAGGMLYFTADDGAHGRELWRTDGTQAGTVRLTDVNPGPGGANATVLYADGDTVYVSADDSVHGAEPWKVDATASTPPNTAATVTGGGWITSAAGAYAADPTLAGKVTFGFVSRYQQGAAAPTGNIEFHFKLGSLNFNSAGLDTLLVSGAKAQFAGSGTINGQGDYAFSVTAIDGGRTGPDQFRIKIWDRATGRVVYDTQMGQPDDASTATPLGGGSIVIHA